MQIRLYMTTTNESESGCSYEEIGDEESIAHLKVLMTRENLNPFKTVPPKRSKTFAPAKIRVYPKTSNEEEARLKALEERMESLEKDYKDFLDKSK